MDRQSAKVTPDEVREAAVTRSEALRRMSCGALSELPEASEEIVSTKAGEIRVTTYRECLPGGDIQVVVQGHVQRLFGVAATMWVEGSVARQDGGTLPAPQERLGEFT